MADGLGQLGDNALGSLGETPGFWTAPGEAFFQGSDSSWLNFSLNLGFHTVNLEIPPEWIALARSILLWIIRIFFVFGCIKLVMN
jgi:hypothetical protein